MPRRQNPVEVDRLFFFQRDRVFDQTFDAGEAGIKSNQHQRAGGIVIQHEFPAGAFDFHRVAFFQLVEDEITERIAGTTLDVELRLQAIAGTTGDRFVALQFIIELEPHILTSQKMQRLAARHLE